MKRFASVVALVGLVLLAGSAGVALGQINPMILKCGPDTACPGYWVIDEETTCVNMTGDRKICVSGSAGCRSWIGPWKDCTGVTQSGGNPCVVSLMECSPMWP